MGLFSTDAPDPTPGAIQRKQMLAQALMQQSMTPDQSQTAGGYVVPYSPLQGLAKMMTLYASNKLGRQADDMQEQQRQAGANDVSRYVQALRGTPAEPAHELAPDMQGPAAPAQSAVPGDMNKAIAVALQSQNPTLQQVGGQLLGGLTTAALPKNAKWVRTEIPDGKGGTQVGFVNENSPNPLSTFQIGGTAPAKKEFVNGTAVDPYAAKPGDVVPVQANPYQDLVVPGPNGPVQNEPLVQAKKAIAGAGKTSVNQTVQNKVGGSLAEQVGPILKESMIQANGAAQQVDAAQRVVKAIDSGKVIAGPGASARVKLGQLGEMLGVTGSDEAEKLANTRQAIRGLAELTLQGRKLMRGEGQITENEGRLAQQAMSGNIDDLTPAEVKQLAIASERAARFNYAQHEQKLKTMGQDKNEEVRNLVPYYQAGAMPPPMSAPLPAQGQWAIRPIQGP